MGRKASLAQDGSHPYDLSMGDGNVTWGLYFAVAAVLQIVLAIAFAVLFNWGWLVGIGGLMIATALACWSRSTMRAAASTRRDRAPRP